ncbi:MAG: hypothetical protein WDW38_002293 [Sanguina aurantia]
MLPGYGTHTLNGTRQDNEGHAGNRLHHQPQDVQAAGMNSQHPQHQQQRQQHQQTTAHTPRPYATEPAYTMAAAAAHATGGAQHTWGSQTIRGAKAPGWLLYDKQVLRFYAYFLEHIEHSPLEDWRVRRCQVRVYLEDDSVEVVEPREANSGLPQGTLLTRGKVSLTDGSRLTWRQLSVGGELKLYGRSYRLVGCDASTRTHMEKAGLPQSEDRPFPEGKYDLGRQPTHSTLPPADSQEGLSDRVLRFFCCWDDTARVFGLKLPFALHYYLGDDTVEVAEMHLRNGGRDPFPLLLSRSKLPKTIPPVGGRPMSPEARRKLALQHYHWTELRIGGLVQVYGRSMLIYDMDRSTKGWYAQHMGAREADMRPIPVDFDMSVKRPPLVVPPHTSGFGSEEDSRRNVLDLQPKAPQGDYMHFMETWNKVMRFSAKMVQHRGRQLVGPHDAQRRFVISYHLLDQTLSVWEPPQANSGMKGGTFLERTKVKKEGGGGAVGSLADIGGGRDNLYTDADMEVGRVVVLFSRAFELLDADESSLCYMEKAEAAGGSKYPYANFNQVCGKLQAMVQSEAGAEQLRDGLLTADGSGSGHISPTHCM